MCWWVRCCRGSTRALRRYCDEKCEPPSEASQKGALRMDGQTTRGSRTSSRLPAAARLRRSEGPLGIAPVMVNHVISQWVTVYSHDERPLSIVKAQAVRHSGVPLLSGGVVGRAACSAA